VLQGLDGLGEWRWVAVHLSGLGRKIGMGGAVGCS
jgi:hypothetical protein